MSDEARELLASEEYQAASTAVMSGTERAALPQEQRDILTRARELTDTPPPGLPMPTRFDRTRGGDA